ncbi:MAG: hypothetical protein AAGE96_20270 [Cyanobacteria bacterium P01_G01_bin.19]
MNDADNNWYVVKQEDGTCEVIQLNSSTAKTPLQSSVQSQWGSYSSEQEAIAKKIGLIRAGKCKPK